jgi:hypothetical protein
VRPSLGRHIGPARGAHDLLATWADEQSISAGMIGATVSAPTDATQLFRFQRSQENGLHVYVSSATDDAIPQAVWRRRRDRAARPGISERLFARYGPRFDDGEVLAVWHALAWRLVHPRACVAIPTFERDHAADVLGIPRDEVPLIRWEYCVDMGDGAFRDADRGFLAAHSVIPGLRLRPPGSSTTRPGPACCRCATSMS